MLKLQCSPIAVIAAKIPQAAGLFFPDTKERPAEAPYVALEKSPATRNCSGKRD
jgi:hypothetical protein